MFAAPCHTYSPLPLDHLHDAPPAGRAERLDALAEHDAVQLAAVHPFAAVARALEGADLAGEGAAREPGVHLLLVVPRQRLALGLGALDVGGGGAVAHELGDAVVDGGALLLVLPVHDVVLGLLPGRGDDACPA